MTKPNGSTAKWIAIIVASAIACASWAWNAGSDSVKTVATRLDTVELRMDERLDSVERDTTEVKTDVKYLVRMMDDMNRKLDKVLGL